MAKKEAGEEFAVTLVRLSIMSWMGPCLSVEGDPKRRAT